MKRTDEQNGKRCENGCVIEGMIQREMRVKMGCETSEEMKRRSGRRDASTQLSVQTVLL